MCDLCHVSIFFTRKYHHSFWIEQQHQSRSSPRAVTASAAMAAEEEAVRRERAARSLAIEKAYVHDVYEQVGKGIIS